MVESHSLHKLPFAVGPTAERYTLLVFPLGPSFSMTRPNGWRVGDWQYEQMYTVPIWLRDLSSGSSGQQKQWFDWSHLETCLTFSALLSTLTNTRT
jgi:hypothetical protein